MGRATSWFRSLLGSSKKSSSTSPVTKANRKSYSGSISNFKIAQLNSSVTDSITRKSGTWGGDDLSSTSYVGSIDANKHAIAVAAATAAVAEAAIAAAQAAAEVVRLTNAGTSRSIPSPCGGGGGYHNRENQREVAAAIKIQSAFRAYLARKALRALKGLVKLQAIVRGRIVRKQSADMLRRMQALARIQARACASRAYISGSSQPFSKSAQFHLANGCTKSRFDHNVKNVGLDSSWLDRWMEEESTWKHIDATTHENLGMVDEKSDKILEIDTWHPRISPRQSTHHFTTSGFSTKYQKPHPSVSSGEISSLKSPNSPYGKSASSRRNVFTPTRSECSRSFFGEYVGYPNYMTYTESSIAKVRSQSVPRQRMVLPEKVGSGRQLVYGHNRDVETSSEKGLFVHANLRNKAHSGSVHKYRNKL